jgi:imidazole glycerol-phosphate synthase subunit HisF
MRNIIRIDIKNDFVVKGRQFEGYRRVSPIQAAFKDLPKKDYEIFLYDVVATLFNRNSIIKQLSTLLENSFLPVIVGGGINSIEKADNAFRLGVDRIALNSTNFRNYNVMSYIAEKYGQQSVIGHIEAKKIEGTWRAMYQNGREIGSSNMIEHIERLQFAGAGELVISSVDNDGMLNGFPLELASMVDCVANVPVVLSGGITNFSAIEPYQDLKSIKGLAISRAYLEKLC